MSNLHVLILAAGQGKRMKSALPKILHPVLYRPMIHYVIDLAQSLSPQSISVVVGKHEALIKEACQSYTDIQFVLQKEPRGTGDAVMSSRENFANQTGTLVVLNADVILLRSLSLHGLLKQHTEKSSSASLVTTVLSDPSGYGRILRDSSGAFLGIREDADCDSEQRKVSEINSGVYAFEIESLFKTLSALGSSNAQGEYYLTDVFESLLKSDRNVSTWTLDDEAESQGINDRRQLVAAEKVIQKRIHNRLFEQGVTLHDPESTHIDSLSEFESDIEVEGNCRIINSRFAGGTKVESGCRIENSEIGAHVVLKEGCYLEQSKVGNESVLGPYAHLRPGSELSERVKLGNFVEVKKSHIGEGSKASHLSYVGDAEIGKNVNLGCGFITCNFDGGPKKHKTTIEDEVFVGSDTQVVAPVTIGKGAYVGSGTTLTRNVPAGALAISRTKQENKEGYADRLRKRRSSKVDGTRKGKS